MPRKDKQIGIRIGCDMDSKQPVVAIKDMIKFVDDFGEFAIKNFEKARDRRVQEMLDYEENVDVRDEKEWTRFAATNMKALITHLVKELKALEKDSKRVIKNGGI